MPRPLPRLAPLLSFADPKIPGITGQVSQARTGGISSSFGLAQDPYRFLLACRQTGPISRPDKLPKEASVLSEDTSILFTETRVQALGRSPHTHSSISPPAEN